MLCGDLLGFACGNTLHLLGDCRVVLVVSWAVTFCVGVVVYFAGFLVWVLVGGGLGVVGHLVVPWLFGLW